ncbi:hypothetical protein SAY86_010677 [Trapa natans]|uniref:CBS domain-containing protein CBSX5 n=1 Tax=Trapa natans TaxID=22666 RepID=A0AAN7R0C9_TRANT|nr:hypothetical protein SAY86_010677 [Trapa natans]
MPHPKPSAIHSGLSSSGQSLEMSMAVGLLSQKVSDLCLGKPALVPIPASSSIRDAVYALGRSGESHLSVWSCDHRGFCEAADDGDVSSCRCVGKVCMADVICYLCREENLQRRPGDALEAPVAEVLPESSDLIVRHVENSSSLLEAIDLILQGAQNLVVPIQSKWSSRRKPHGKPAAACPTPTHHGNGLQFCWLTQEDVIRFLLNSITLFSPLSALPIDSLGLVTDDFLAVDYDSPASSAAVTISLALAHQTSVAVTDSDGTLVGEISPFTLAFCDEAVAAAIATLSCGDLMAYIDGGGPPTEELVQLVELRLRERNLVGLLEEFSFGSSIATGGSSSSSSDEEGRGSPVGRLMRGGQYSRSSRYSARMVRRSEAIVCHRASSLVAVMVQAIAHRVNYVWVIEDDCSLVGIVTFSGVLKIFREHFQLHDNSLSEIRRKV